MLIDCYTIFPSSSFPNTSSPEGISWETAARFIKKVKASKLGAFSPKFKVYCYLKFVFTDRVKELFEHIVLREKKVTGFAPLKKKNLEIPIFEQR